MDSVYVMLDFECREKTFFQSLVANVCVCKHAEDHSYPQKQTGVSYDDSNRLYDLKREVTVIFEFPYPSQRQKWLRPFWDLQKMDFSGRHA